jgi:hypothetical protein
VNEDHPAQRTKAALDAEFGNERPPIVVLCGSARFYDEFQETDYRLTLEGFIVLSVGLPARGEGAAPGPAEKLALDALHQRKIDLADRVHVLNVGGYLGESTRSEVAYAEALGKPITYEE